MYACSLLVERIQSNVFLPKSVADAVQKLVVTSYTPQEIGSDVRPITTLTAYIDRINNQNDKLDGTDTNLPEQKYSVALFIDAYYGVKEAIINWYRENNINTNNLNMG